jgi:hypothetical protein
MQVNIKEEGKAKVDGIEAEGDEREKYEGEKGGAMRNKERKKEEEFIVAGKPSSPKIIIKCIPSDSSMIMIQWQR